MKGIPWEYLGAGAIGIVALIVALYFWTKWKGNNPVIRTPCLNDPQVKQALTNSQITTQSLARIEQHIEAVKIHSVKQTEVLKNMLKIQEKQSDILSEIAENGKK